MREIKFRAWDGNSNKMLYQNIPMVWRHKDGDLVFSMNGVTDGNIKIQQFTGLKDKNGVEIYEGDILKSDFYEILQEIKWNDDIEEECHSSCGFDDIGRHLCHTNQVIGNIYENPELLNKKI